MVSEMPIISLSIITSPGPSLRVCTLNEQIYALAKKTAIFICRNLTKQIWSWSKDFLKMCFLGRTVLTAAIE